MLVYSDLIKKFVEVWTGTYPGMGFQASVTDLCMKVFSMGHENGRVVNNDVNAKNYKDGYDEGYGLGYRIGHEAGRFKAMHDSPMSTIKPVKSEWDWK